MGKSSWWLLFPFYGLEVTDDPRLNKPLFGNATLISRDYLPLITGESVSASDSTNRATASTDSPGGDWIGSSLQKYGSFLAVRASNAMKIDDDNNVTTDVQDATHRAYELAALLSLVMLARSKYPRTCGLAEQQHVKTQNIYGVESPGSSKFESHGVLHPTIVLPLLSESSPTRITRQELIDLLTSPAFAEFHRAFQLKARPSGLCETIRRSAVCLADAIHAATPELQTISAVTSLEILLGNEERYKVLGTRLLALLGYSSETHWHARSVLDARNNYVHEGKRLVDATIAKDAIYLGLASILRYSTVCKNFPNLEEFRHYLDFAYSGFQHYQSFHQYPGFLKEHKGRLPVWSKEEISSFKTLLSHDPDEQAFPWNRRPE